MSNIVTSSIETIQRLADLDGVEFPGININFHGATPEQATQILHAFPDLTPTAHASSGGSEWINLYPHKGVEVTIFIAGLRRIEPNVASGIIKAARA